MSFLCDLAIALSSMSIFKVAGIKLLEVKHDKILDEYTFRYAIDYEKKLFKRELMVTVNSENKVSAINTKEVKPTPF